jgi:hypothetical protein
VPGCCKHGNEPLGPIKSGEFLDYLSDCQLMKVTSFVYCRPTYLFLLVRVGSTVIYVSQYHI